eukprot:tig00020629_g12468.t1
MERFLDDFTSSPTANPNIDAWRKTMPSVMDGEEARKLILDKVSQHFSSEHDRNLFLGAYSLIKGTELGKAIFFPSEPNFFAFARYLEWTKRTMDICVFTITDDKISNRILDAHRRGVRVRIITDNDKSADRGSDIERLADAGIPIKVDKTAAHMHNKFAVLDNSILLNGSFNWTVSAARDNNENIVITDNERIVAQFAREFDALWAKF